MVYLHGSLVETHGCLKSSNVVIDSHWLCKISEVAMRHISQDDVGNKDVSINTFSKSSSLSSWGNGSLRCHYTKSNPIDDHSNISSKKLQKQNFKPLGHYTCMHSGTSHLQTVQENVLSRIILATYRKFTVTTVRFTQNVS